MTHFFKFSFRHPTNAVGAKVCVSGLDATKTAQIFITLFLPFCDQVLISYVLLHTIFIQFCNNTQQMRCMGHVPGVEEKKNSHTLSEEKPEGNTPL